MSNTFINNAVKHTRLIPLLSPQVPLSALTLAIAMILSNTAYGADDCTEHSATDGQTKLCISKTDLGTLRAYDQDNFYARAISSDEQVVVGYTHNNDIGGGVLSYGKKAPAGMIPLNLI